MPLVRNSKSFGSFAAHDPRDLLTTRMDRLRKLWASRHFKQQMMNLRGSTSDTVTNIRVLHGEVNRVYSSLNAQLAEFGDRQSVIEARLARLVVHASPTLRRSDSSSGYPAARLSAERNQQHPQFQRAVSCPLTANTLTGHESSNMIRRIQRWTNARLPRSFSPRSLRGFTSDNTPAGRDPNARHTFR